MWRKIPASWIRVAVTGTAVVAALAAISLVLHSGQAGSAARREERFARLTDDNRTLSTIRSPSVQFPGEVIPESDVKAPFSLEGSSVLVQPEASAGLELLRVDGAYGVSGRVSADSPAAGLALALGDAQNVWVATPNSQFGGWAIEHYADGKLLTRDVAGLAPTGDDAVATLRWNANLLELIVDGTQIVSAVIDGPVVWAGFAATRPVKGTFFGTAVHIQH